MLKQNAETALEQGNEEENGVHEAEVGVWRIRLAGDKSKEEEKAEEEEEGEEKGDNDDAAVATDDDLRISAACFAIILISIEEVSVTQTDVKQDSDTIEVL